MESSPLSIVILDNHALVRAGFRLLLDRYPTMKVVGEAGDLSAGLEIVARNKPDIVLFEFNLSEQENTAVITQILQASEKSRLILVTGIPDPSISQAAVENGVMGVVLKTQSPEVLIKAIEKVHSGEVWLERLLIANVISRLSRNQFDKKNPEENGISILSDREREIVRLIGQGLKNRKISTLLCISETTVRHHLTSIYSKLGVSDRLELLVFAHRYGLVKQLDS
jgi:two-component system nitrate/nitrite response regulator NarL